MDPDGNKVLGSGQVIKNPSQPGPSNECTPSGGSAAKSGIKAGVALGSVAKGTGKKHVPINVKDIDAYDDFEIFFG